NQILFLDVDAEETIQTVGTSQPADHMRGGRPVLRTGWSIRRKLLTARTPRGSFAVILRGDDPPRTPRGSFAAGWAR
ncbi:MAG: hypothetical protein PVJ28_02095, partial [Acidimicrobiia bacterium]